MATTNIFDKATVVLTPTTYKAGKVFCEKPANGSGDFTFSRAGTAVRTDADGNSETMAANVIRLDYRFDVDGSNTCPVYMVVDADGESLSLTGLDTSSFVGTEATIFYMENFQMVVKVYTSDGNMKLFRNGAEIETTVETVPTSLSFPNGSHSILSKVGILPEALADAKATTLSANSFTDTYSRDALLAYVAALVNGYELLSASTILALDFDTFDSALLPSANKVGSVAIYKKADGSNPQGSLSSETFTRPNTAEDASESGAVAINEDGTLRTLLEDEPAWSYINGEWVLEMPPSVKNQVDLFDTSANDGSNVAITYESKDWGLGSLLQSATVFGDNSTLRLRYCATNAIGANSIVFYIEMDDGSQPDIQQNENAGDLTVVFKGGISDVEINSIVNVKSNIYRVHASVENATESNVNNGIIKYTTQSSKGFRVSGFTFIRGTTLDLGDIPTVGTALTRSAPLTTYAGLQAQGQFGNPDLSYLVYLTKWLDGGVDADLFTFQDASSNDIYILRAKTGGNLVLVDVGTSTEIGAGLAADTEGKLGFTYDGSTLKFFVNGSPDGSLSVSGNAEIDKIVIQPDGNYFAFKDKMHPTALADATMQTDTTL